MTSRSLFPIKQATFFKGVTRFSDIPSERDFEIAFWGRSNVGKSSLLNALWNQKGLARTSNTPGRTQQINFFEVEPSMYWVDLPGYGYAQAPLHLIQDWTHLTNRYLQSRSTLRCLFLLIDIRHGIKKVDTFALNFLDQHQVPYQIVLTKADKISTSVSNQMGDLTNLLLENRSISLSTLTTSSKNQEGVRELQKRIQDLWKQNLFHSS
jgi:GTP-binding protein